VFELWLLLSLLDAGAKEPAASTNLPLLRDCSDPADIVATIQPSDRVEIRYSAAGGPQTCYAVSVTAGGKVLRGFLLGAAHPDVAAFEREARSRIPAIPDPPKPVPAPQEAKEKTLVPETPKSFAGLSGTSPDGRRVSLDNISSPTLVLYFWSASNQGSIREAEGMESIYNQYRGKGVGLVGVVSGSSATRVRSVLRDEEVLWPQILDNGDIESHYPGSKEAKYYILDRQRNTVAALNSASEVQSALKKMRQP